MAVTDPIKPVQIRFGKNMENYFDEIENVDIGNRKSDSGLIETDRPMIKPRPGTVRVGSNQILDWSAATAYVVGDVVLSGDVLYRCTTGHTNAVPPSANWSVYTQTVAKQFFYTDKTFVRRHYKTFNNNLYYLNAGVWTLLKALGTNDVEFSQQRVPMLNIRDYVSTQAYIIGDRVVYNGVIYACILGSTGNLPTNVTYWAVSSVVPTTYTSPTATTVAETIVKAAGDTIGAVGKILIVTSGVYKGCYASIISISGSTYTLGGAGILTGIAINTTYQICDYIADALMVSRQSISQNEVFFDGIMELTQYEGFVTASLRQIAAITATETVGKLTAFNNQCYTFKGSSVFYTGGFPGNPFFFNFTGVQTLGGNGVIIDIFGYKTRLITIGSNFLFSIQSSGIIDRHSSTYGGIKGGYVNLGEDVYILTTDRTLISLNETINGVVGVKNVGDQIENYLVDFRASVCFGMDGKKIYMYGQADTNTVGTMCIFDITYKMWYTVTGLRPSSIISDSGDTYISDNNSDIVRKFDSSVLTDTSVGTDRTTSFTQILTSKEVDRSDIFSVKSLMDMYISFENYTQTMAVDVYMGLNKTNGKKDRGTIIVNEIPIGGGTIGGGTIGENLFGFTGKLDIISVPILKHIAFQSDEVNIFKFRLSGSAFYINQIDLGITEADKKLYFDPANTI